MKTDELNHQSQNFQNAAFPYFLSISSPITVERNINRPLALNNFIFQEFEKSSKTANKISFFSSECFYLIYSWNGSIIFQTNNKAKYIRSQQSCIIYDRRGDGIKLEFTEPNARYCVIGFNKSENNIPSRGTSCFNKFTKLFTDCISSNYYIGGANLEIFEKINSLKAITPTNVADQFILEGILFQIYGLKMIQILEEGQRNHKLGREFTMREMEQLHSISEYIAKNPGKEYTVQSLCLQTGLGPNKLQRGFKKMHKKTVIDYIRQKRLEKALYLLKTTNLTISEIVYCVGLSSRSYFSKIFKKQYKCSPKYYQQMLKD